MAEFSCTEDQTAHTRKIDRLQKLHLQFSNDIAALGYQIQGSLSLISLDNPTTNPVLLYSFPHAGRQGRISDGAVPIGAALSSANDSGRACPPQRPRPRSIILPRLTPREKECLRWAAKGLSDHDIGDVLSLSPSTVTGYMANVRNKFKVRTRIQAAVIAASCGMISP